MVAGAVWVKWTTPAHVPAKATAVTVSVTASGMKRSSNSHTLRTMLPSGSTRAAGHSGRDPVMARRGGLAVLGLPGDQEHRQAHASQGTADPGDQEDGLVNPEPAQHEREDELGDQQQPHDRELATMQVKTITTDAPVLGAAPAARRPVSLAARGYFVLHDGAVWAGRRRPRSFWLWCRHPGASRIRELDPLS